MLPSDPVSTEDALTTPRPRSIKKAIIDILQVVVLAAVMYVIFGFVARPHVVDGSSMQPHYHTGEFVLTAKLPVMLNTLKRGDVVVIQSPAIDPGKQYFKRIIGLPGEQIEISDNQVLIYNQQHPNGFPLRESYLGSATTTSGREFIPEDTKIQIPKDDYVVMGDNRDASFDSRAWGFVSRNHVDGVAYFIYWPVGDMGIIPHPSY